MSRVGSPEAGEATRFSDQKRSSRSNSPQAVKEGSPKSSENDYLSTLKQSTEKKYHNVRRQLEHEFVEEENQKLLTE